MTVTWGIGHVVTNLGLIEDPIAIGIVGKSLSRIRGEFMLALWLKGVRSPAVE